MKSREKIEWPGGARIAVGLNVVLEQFEREAADVRDLVSIPLIPNELVKKGVPDLLLKSWDEYGEVGFWRLVDLLDKHNIPATGVFSGLAVERFPDMMKAFTKGGGGREICAHSWAQDIRPYNQDREQLRANIRKCVDVIKKVTGERPVGWISPGGQCGENMLPVLAEEGFIWHADYSTSDAPFIREAGGGKKLVGMTVPWDVNDVIYIRGQVPPSHYVEMFCRSFDVLYEEGGQIIGAAAHGTIYGRPFGIWAYDQVIRYAKSFPKVWFATRRQIAEWYLQRYGK